MPANEKHFTVFLFILPHMRAFFTACNQNNSTDQTAKVETLQPDYNGFESQIKYGEHLVTVSVCHDCHTPKKLGPHGMQLDSSPMLSGHPAQLPGPSFNRKEMESKGVICTSDLTAWVGPWGISYTANLTPDPTGIGNWT